MKNKREKQCKIQYLIAACLLLALVPLDHRFAWAEDQATEKQPDDDQFAMQCDENRIAIQLAPELAQRFAERADLGDSFKIFVGQKSETGQQAILGKVKLDKQRLVFEPRFPFETATIYSVRLIDPSDAKVILFRISFELEPVGNTEPATVTAIFPSAAELPENLLKFYIHFSAPMTTRDSYAHISLLDQAGTEIELPFLEIEEELWNREGTRLTLLFDPGRVKRGLKPREDSGAPLVAGNDYTLHISKNWRDARGKPLKDSVEKKFRAVAADYQQPDPKKWKLDLPKAQTREPLSIHFDKAIDQALAQHAINVSQDDQLIAGNVSLNADETAWQFVPDQNWATGQYQIQIDHRLEDHCGNSVGRAFEVDLQEAETTQAPATLSIDFELSQR